jgi:hypothetical protein
VSPFKTLPREYSHLKPHTFYVALNVTAEGNKISFMQTTSGLYWYLKPVLFITSFLHALLILLSILTMFVSSRTLTIICYEPNAEIKTM